jgi:FkbM family methyltransferase
MQYQERNKMPKKNYYKLDLAEQIAEAKRVVMSGNSEECIQWIKESTIKHEETRKHYRHYRSNHKKDEIILDCNIGFSSIFAAECDLGNVSIIDQFGPHELLIFARYALLSENEIQSLKKKSMIALDVGSNIGIHGIILSKLQFKVVAFEPNTELVLEILKNQRLNKVSFELVPTALIPKKMGCGISENNLLEFTVIEDNVTASTLAISGKQVYGRTKTTFVPYRIAIKEFEALLENYNVQIIKLDCEGVEPGILEDLIESSQQFSLCVVEVNGNSHEFYEIVNRHKCKQNIKFFSDRSLVEIDREDDIPKTWREGSLYVVNS